MVCAMNLCGIKMIYSLIFLLLVHIADINASTCNESLTYNLRDDQFTASSIYSMDFNASSAKFDEGGWAASVYDSFQYLKIDLEGLWEITSITNKDISRWSWYHTQSFRILHSKDGLTWTAYNTYLSEEILGETFNRQDTLTTIQFNPTIKTRFIVFNPIRYNWRPSMRMELYGCKRNDVASNDISTIVETNIESDTVWIPSQSPVIIDRHISIRPLATLTIQAGVSVIFTSSDAGIDVYGTLRVNGLEAVETIFTSSFPVLSKKRQWKGIFHQPGGNISLWYTVVRQATIGIQGDSIGIYLGHCNIYSCDTGIQLSGGTTSKHKISDSTFTILHTRSFRNEYGIRLHGTAQLPYIYIDQSEFSFNSKHGLVIENWNDESSSDTVLHLYNSKLNDNYKSGLLSSCSYQKHILVIENSSFSRNGETGLYLYQSFYEPTTVFDISYSNFEENAYNGVEYKYICYYCHGNLSNSLRHNHMIHNKRFQIVFSFTNRDDQPVMMNVFLTNNTIRKHSYYERYAVSIGANRVIGVFEIVNNTFDDLHGGFGINSGQDSSVQVNMINNIFENIYGEQMAVLYISNTRLHFVENIISNCSVNNLVDLVDGLSHQIKNNSFNNNAVTYCIVRVGEEYNKIKSINADYNYWGTDNISLVKACICDVFLNSLKARVRTDYVFLDPSMTSAQHIPTVDDFHITFDTDFNAYVIGGVIKSLSNLPTFESDTVIVNRTVIIDYSAEVHLFGITFNFTAKRGIIVLGNLRLGETLNGTILQAQNVEQRWNGIHLFKEELKLSNILMKDCDITLFVHNGASKIDVSNVSVVQTDGFITALNFIGNLELNLKNSIISTNNIVANIEINKTETLYINFENTALYSSTGKLLSLSEMVSKTNVTTIYINAKNSMFTTSSENLFEINTCSSHIQSRLMSSTFSVENGGKTIFNCKAMSVDLEGILNTYENSDTGLFVSFCDKQENKQDFNIGLNLTNNKFENIASTAIETHGQLKDIVIQNNYFVNNGACIKLAIAEFDFKSLSISQNVFSNNTADGIVKLLQPRSGNSTITMTQNVFENNKGIVLSFISPYINIFQNFFENKDAAYNLKVERDTRSYTGKVLNASQNYWGTTDVNGIEKRVYDNSYDNTLFKVTFRPYLGSKNYSDIQNEEASFISSSGDIGGILRENVTLTKGGSPYIVASNIVVNENAVLSLEAGVVLLFKEDVGITVYGIFNVLGSIDELIQMKPDASEKPWRGLDIKSSRGNFKSKLEYLAVTNTTSGIHISSMNTYIHNVTSVYSALNGFTLYVNSNISDVTISELNASNNMKSGIEIVTEGYQMNKTVFEVNKCTASENKIHGIVIKANASVVISQCKVEGNTESGIYVYQEFGGRITISSSNISRNVKHAIKEYFTEEFVVDSCIISDHTYRRFSIYSSYRISYVYLERNGNTKFRIKILNTVFKDNINDGIHIWFGRANFGDCMLQVENNTFINGNKTIGIYFNSLYENMAFVNIVRNLFVNNSNTYGALLEFQFQDVGDVTFEKNTFDGNVAKTTILFTGHVRHSIGTIAIQNNSIFGDWATESLIDLNSFQPVTVTNNHLRNLNSDACVLRAPTFRESFEIDATFNYWGKTVATEIVEIVCGFERDMDKSFVNYIPFYSDDNRKQLVSLTQNNFDVQGTFGGEITTNFTIPMIAGPIIISRALFVRPGHVLTIPAGAVLRFKESRGIYIQGVLKISTGISELTTLTSINDAVFWNGIVLKSTSDEYSTFNNVHIAHTMKGFTAISNKFEMRRSLISNSRASCLTVKPDDSIVNTYDFEGTSISDCKENGILFTDDGIINVYNVNITNASTCIKMDEYFGGLTIKSSNITECSTAVDVRFRGDWSKAGNITVDSCRITNSSNGLEFLIQSRWTINSVNIKHNIFTNITNNALSIDYTAYKSSKYIGHLDIGFNTFYNTCHINLKTWNNAILTLHDNTIEKGNCEGLGKCYLEAYANGNKEFKGRMFNISTNIFRNLVSDCIVDLVSSETTGIFEGVFYYNQFLTTETTVGTVTLDSKYFNFSNNIFDNPMSPYDIYVKMKGTSSVNASNNWWGNANTDIAYARIFDFHRDSTLLLVNITSILTDRNIDCSGVDNCSYNGECVSPNKCRCFSGWAGEKCLGYDCSGIHNCYGNGLCVGSNMCQCKSGWSGHQCIYALCSNVNNCSDHGFCIRPDICTCAPTFTGENCSLCIPSHWGTRCEPCPNCQNGECNLNTGTCDCFGAQWTGNLCDICSETFYGPDCLPLLTVLNVIPNQGLDKGGNDVHVWGHNFPQTDTYKCKFETDVVNGVWVAWNHVVCSAPRQADGIVSIEISPDGIEFSNNKVKYLYFATCPPSSCGRDASPPHGQCLFGGCSCNLPWTGENCTIELLTPVIIKPPQQTINESVMYDFKLQLSQGSIPVTWSLIDHPGNMIIDERTGRLLWSNVIGRLIAYSVIVEATNVVGKHSIELTITVPVSYSVNLVSLDPNGILPRPKQIEIFGKVAFSDFIAPRIVPIKLIINSTLTDTTRVLTTTNDNNNSTSFKTTYYPRPDDAGTFRVEAYHPGFEQSSGTTLTWVILGMRCEPNFVSLKSYIDGSLAVFANVSTLKNIGGYPIINISSKVYGIENVHVFKSEDKTEEAFFMTDLNSDEMVSFGFQMKDVKPMLKTFYIVFSTTDRTYERLQINVDLSIKKPILVFEPNAVKDNIIRGTQNILDITIKNIGDIQSRDVNIHIPNESKISLMSLSRKGETLNYANEQLRDNLAIPALSEAIMSLAVTVESNTPLGELRGTIAVNTNLTTFILPYAITITSERRLNLTFVIKDEYTYFATGSPLVIGAEVKLVNPRRGYSETRLTYNDTGAVLFENIYEDKYTVYAKAEGHSTYSAIIIATSYTTVRDIFLQRTAVTYTWTVTPTTVEDKYKITLDSTFETFVPMPVVTIEPNKLDTVPFETEERESVDFTITNHGLIRADNLRFSLPTGHPTLQFQSTVDVIGDLAANSSIIIPVKITLKSGNTRHGSCSILLIVYDYDCGGTRSNSASVILTGSCGGGNTGGSTGYVGDSSGSGSGVLIFYRPTTPVPCDCLAALLKKCILVHIPIVGCVASEGNLAASTIVSCALQDIFPAIGCFVKVEKLIKLSNSTGPDLNVAIMDMAMSCGVSPFCSVCGKLYNALRCLQELEKECGNKRKRRDVSSDVVNNFIVTSKPMNNFRLMMDEIFGREQMFSVKKEWYPAFKTVTSDDSENGSNLSKDEKSFVLNTLTSDISKLILDRFLERWNNTVSAWYNGTLNHEIKIGGVINLSKLSMMTQQYIKDTKTASYRGFDSIFSDFDHALNAYVLAEKETQQEGNNKKDGAICAKVRVRIIQDLVLTRDAFNARFEIENGENSALESIHVEIEIKHNTGSGEIVNGLFSIGDPDLLGLTGVDGDGRLGVDLSGSAEWLIIPYSIAAPNGDVLFNVGGRLSYRVGGSNFSVPLLPDTITVKPNPSLVLHYFHEKYVRGDDPLTEEKEPVIPFTLAVMVMNAGYGLARALKISSAQPQIIENEKGLLITFRIIGGFLGNEPISPSLIVDFGDIQSFETKTARWVLTSTLQGTFYNFSATFENINPLGDPQLSLFENIWYHELIHLVRLFRDGQADGFDDFLVNDFVDNKGIPEKVYNSANGSDVYNVMTATVLGLSSSTFVKSNMKTYTLVCMEVLTKTSNWFYARIKNNVTSPDQTLLDVRSDDNRNIVVDKNIWTTTHILDLFLIHLFDYIKNNDSVAENTKMKYFLTFGPKNMHPPKFNKTSYSITISPETPKGKPMLTVHAYDVDKNEITYDLVGLNQGSFDIDPHNGVVTLLNIPLAVGVFELQIICRDDGIPSLSGVVKVNINVISGEKITTTLITYSKTSAPISVTSQPKNSVSDKTTIPANSSGALEMTTKLSDDKTTEQDTSTGVVYATTNSLSDETTYHDTSKVVVDTTSKSSFGKTTEQDTSTYSVNAITGSPGTNIPEPDTSAIVVDSSTQSSRDRETEPAISSGKVDATRKSSTTVDRFTSNNAVDMTSKSSFRKTSIPHSSTTSFATTLGTSSAVKLVSHTIFLIVSNVLILSLRLID